MAEERAHRLILDAQNALMLLNERDDHYGRKLKRILEQLELSVRMPAVGVVMNMVNRERDKITKVARLYDSYKDLPSGTQLYAEAEFKSEVKADDNG